MFPGTLNFPRIEKSYARSLEIADIPRHDDKIRFKRCGRYEGIAFRALVRNMKRGTRKGYEEVDIQYAAGEGWNNLIIEPMAHLYRLKPIPPFKQQDTDFKLENRDNRYK